MLFVLHCTGHREACHKVHDACRWSRGTMAPMQPATVHLVPAGPSGGCLLRRQRRLALGTGSMKWLSACAGLLSHSPHTTAGGSKKRGADIAGMPSKRSNLADRLGPAGMSTLAVLLGHDVTQADLDRLQQVGAAEAG